MPPRKKRSKKASNKNNNLYIFFAIVIVLAIISSIVAYYYQDEFKETNKVDQQISQTQNTQLEGTWVSNYDGTMLTIGGSKATFESPSVDESNKVNGKITVEENIVTFADEDGSCENIEGHYLYSIDENGELFFKLIKDSCPKRLELMTANWFKL